MAELLQAIDEPPLIGIPSGLSSMIGVNKKT
jgi:hypothetical protein